MIITMFPDHLFVTLHVYMIVTTSPYHLF